MAKDLDGTGVTVNVLVPGGITNTPMVSASGFDQAKMIQPEVMAPPLLWLVSDAAANVTGHGSLVPRFRPNKRLRRLGRQWHGRASPRCRSPRAGLRKPDAWGEWEAAGLPPGSTAWTGISTPGLEQFRPEDASRASFFQRNC